jgi:hypothetical protein
LALTLACSQYHDFDYYKLSRNLVDSAINCALLYDSWNSRACCVTWKQKLQKPPDRIITKTTTEDTEDTPISESNNNQTRDIMLCTTFNSEEEVHSTVWKMKQARTNKSSNYNNTKKRTNLSTYLPKQPTANYQLTRAFSLSLIYDTHPQLPEMQVDECNVPTDKYPPRVLYPMLVHKKGNNDIVGYQVLKDNYLVLLLILQIQFGKHSFTIS